ncbi:MAG: hypothetical protein HFF10_00540 [Angelakisella sp.]|nr:hypothetical protein [Angelakisella sp.]
MSISARILSPCTGGRTAAVRQYHHRALAATVLAFFYNGGRSRNFKWAFYWTYPVHIAVLGAFRLLLRL